MKGVGRVCVFVAERMRWLKELVAERVRPNECGSIVQLERPSERVQLSSKTKRRWLKSAAQECGGSTAQACG